MLSHILELKIYNFKLVDIFNVALKSGWRFTKHGLDVSDFTVDQFCLVVGQLVKILSHITLLLFYSGIETGSKLSTLDLNQALVFLRSNVLGNIEVPFVKRVQLLFDAFDIRMVLLPLFKDEIFVEFIDWFTDLKLVDSFLEVVKISTNSRLNSLFDLGVSFRSLNDGPKSWTTVADETMDELVEVRMTDHSANFFSHTLHILQNLIELRHELSFCWLKRHAFLGKAYSR